MFRLIRRVTTDAETDPLARASGGENGDAFEGRFAMHHTDKTSIACPGCGARFRVTPVRLERTKRFRCPRCNVVFSVDAEPPDRLMVDEDQIVAWLQGSKARQ